MWYRRCILIEQWRTRASSKCTILWQKTFQASTFMCFTVFWFGLMLYRMFFNKMEILSNINYLKSFMTLRVKVFETKLKFPSHSWIQYIYQIITLTKMMPLVFRVWPTRISRPLKNSSEMSNMSHNNFPRAFFPLFTKRYEIVFVSSHQKMKFMVM